MFTKTKICKFHILGICEKGIGCKFAHQKEELNPLPDLSRTKLCKTLINTGSCEDPACTYAHNREELRAILGGGTFRSGKGKAEKAAGAVVAVANCAPPPIRDEKSGESLFKEKQGECCLIVKNTFLEVVGDVDVPLRSRLRSIRTATGRLDTMCC